MDDLPGSGQHGTRGAWPGGHDNDLADLCAMAEACRADDGFGMAIVFRYADHSGLAITVIKLLAELMDERSIPEGVLLAWGGQAIHRST